MHPNSLATTICKILDGGYTDVKTLARLCNESTRTIEWLTKPGARIDRDTEFRIGKVLASFKRMYPELSWDIAPQPKRRIVKQEHHRSDEALFELYDDAGKWRGTWLCPADDVDEDMHADFERYLDKRTKGKRHIVVMRDA